MTIDRAKCLGSYGVEYGHRININQTGPGAGWNRRDKLIKHAYAFTVAPRRGFFNRREEHTLPIHFCHLLQIITPSKAHDTHPPSRVRASLSWLSCFPLAELQHTFLDTVATVNDAPWKNKTAFTLTFLLSCHFLSFLRWIGTSVCLIYVIDESTLEQVVYRFPSQHCSKGSWRFVKRDAEVRSWNDFIGNLWILADSYSYRIPYSFGIYLDFYFQGMCGLCYLCCLVIRWHEEEDYRVDVPYLFQVVVTP